MGDYFSNLAARTMGLGPSIEPRPLSRFEPAPLYSDSLAAVSPNDKSEEMSVSEYQDAAEAAPPEMSAIIRTGQRRTRSNAPESTNAVPPEELELDAIDTSRGIQARALDTPSKSSISLGRPRRNTSRESNDESAEESLGRSAPQPQTTVSGRRAVADVTWPADAPQIPQSFDLKPSADSRDSKTKPPPKVSDLDASTPLTKPATPGRPARRINIEDVQPLPAIDSSLEQIRMSQVESVISGTISADALRASPRVPQSKVAKFAGVRTVSAAARPSDSRSPVRPERIAIATDARMSPHTERSGEGFADTVDSASTVQITIGRVEVKAVTPPATKPITAAPAKSAMSLDDYLRKRSSGVR
jgi:hypothetical protein